jgi:hypothetical protein
MPSGVVNVFIPSFNGKIDDKACLGITTLKWASIPSNIKTIGYYLPIYLTNIF